MSKLHFTTRTATEIRAHVAANPKDLPLALNDLAIRAQRPHPKAQSLDLLCELAGQPRKPTGGDAGAYKAWVANTVTFAATIVKVTPASAPKAPAKAKGRTRKAASAPKAGASADVAALAKQVEALTALVTALASKK